MSPSCFPLFFPPVDSLLARLVACASLVAQLVKNLPAVWETWVQSLGWEDPQGRTWQPTPVFLPGESPWTEELGGLQSTGLQRV